MMTSNVLKGLAAGVILTATTLPVFAAEQIRGIDFIATPGETNILLKTSTTVPYRTVLVSNQKLIIDVDNVNAEESIDTFFKGTGNVSHVVLQPLSRTKLRMIIRGEALGNPVIGFDRGAPATAPTLAGTSINTPREEGWVDDMNQAMDALDEEGTTAATYNPEELNTEDGMHAATDSGAVTAQTAEAAPVAQAAIAPEPAATQTIEKQPIRQAQNVSNTRNPLAQLPPMDNMTLYGVAGLLLLGLGIFIKRKIDQVRMASLSFENLMADHEQGKKVNFRDLADAYRKDKQRQIPDAPQNNNQPQKLFASKPKGLPIGLGSLNAADTVTEKPAPVAGEAPMNDDTLRLLQNRLASASRNNIIPDKLETPPPARQALQQYAKTHQPAAKGKPAATRNFPAPQQPATKTAPQRAAAPDDVLRAELNRAKELQNRMNPRAAKPAPVTPSLGSLNKSEGLKKPAIQQGPRMAKPAGKNGSPLPDNPEVLNFLKDIADRIEKEGKPSLAASINKNIRKNPI